MKTRNQIGAKYTWDLSTFGVNDDNFKQKCEQIKKFEEKIFALEGKLNTDDDILKAFNLCLEHQKLLTPVEAYVYLKQQEDLSRSKYDEMCDYLQKILINYSQKAIFLHLALKKLPAKRIDKMLADKRFEPFRIELEDLKEEKKHQLDDSVDKFLSGADFLGENETIMKKFTDSDMTFEDVIDSKGKPHKLDEITLARYLESPDRTLRKNALKTCHGTFGKNINMLSANYIASVKSTCFFAKQYHYSSALDRAMQEEKVDKKVYDTLIENVRKNLPLLFDYFELKRKKLGQSDFANYDTYMPLNHKTSQTYTYDQAIEVIKKAVAPLGEEYVGLIERAKKERWIDVYPNKNKRSGAFEVGFYGYHPFVLTNFDGRLEDVFTLAHELGHAMHSYFSDKNQDYEKSQYPIFLAEIASTTNEMLLLQYLLSQAKSRAEKENLYDKLFSSVKSTIFRQTMFAEFEERVHNIHESGDALSKDRLCAVYYDLNKDYFGKKVKLLKEVQYEWARIPHFFTPFYVYKYATGLIAALNFSRMLFSGEKGAQERYLTKFLSAGQSKKPCEILRDAGCDLEEPKTYEQTFAYLKEQLKQWKKLQ